MPSRKRHDRELVLDKYGAKCAYCGTPLTLRTMEIDHRDPLHRGGADEPDNLMPACRRCNNRKGGMGLEEFRAEIGAQVDRLRRDSSVFRLAEDFGQVQIKHNCSASDRVGFWFERVEYARQSPTREECMYRIIGSAKRGGDE